jgi:hypothetical protein
LHLWVPKKEGYHKRRRRKKLGIQKRKEIIKMYVCIYVCMDPKILEQVGYQT